MNAEILRLRSDEISVLIDEIGRLKEEIMMAVFDRRRMLKVKIKSLACEARIIRKEERRAHGQLRDELASHRMVVVRREARAAQLAYGFIRGRTLQQMELHVRDPHLQKLVLDRALKLVKKYGPLNIKLAA